MPTGQMDGVMRRLRRVLVPEGPAPSDGQLLDRFISRRDEVAFEALVRRHGPMVLGVCRRVLGNEHDGDDAFQATFLVLVRKATSVLPREAVGNWLYGVAYRTALEARARNARRLTREKQVPDMPQPLTERKPQWSDLRPLLDQELNHLPDKYRLPIVLCDLEGQGRAEVSDRLKLPRGTLSSRLARGRQMLADRLTRRGVRLSGGALAVLLATNAATAAVAPSLILTTVKAASLIAAGQAASEVVSANVAALTQGVLQAMFMTKLKSALMVVVMLALLGSCALFSRGWFATQAGERVVDTRPPAPPLPQEVGPGIGLITDDLSLVFLDGREAGREDVRTPPAISGRVAAVDKDGMGLTIETLPTARGEEPGRHPIKLTDKSKLIFSGVGPGGAKLSEGLMAQVWLAEGSKDVAAAVQLTGKASARPAQDLSGRVVGVAKDGSTISFLAPAPARGEVGATIDVRLTARTMIFYSFITKGGGKPTEGYYADVWLERGSKDTAEKVIFGGSAERPDREMLSKMAEVEGKVLAVAKDGKSFMVEVASRVRGEEPEKRAVKLDDKSRVNYLHVMADGDRPTEGYVARVWFVEGSKDKAADVMLQAIHKERHVIWRGKVVGIAKEGKGLTLEMPPEERGAEPRRVAVRFSDKTDVSYHGVGPDGARLTEGYVAEIWLEEDSTDLAARVMLGPLGVGRR